MPEIRFYTFMTVGWTAFVVGVIAVALIFAPGDISDEFPSGAVQPHIAPTPNTTPSASSEPEALGAEEAREEEEGHDVFVAKGCSACHGQDGERTSIAPALAGTMNKW